MQPDTNYIVLVVAYGEDLPSESINVTISNGKKFSLIFHSYNNFLPIVVFVTIEGPTDTLLQYFSTFNVTCTATIMDEFNDTTIEMVWMDPNGTVVNQSTIMNSIIYSLDLNFNDLQASQVGTYLCSSEYIDSSGNVTVRRYFNISVQGQCI